jgi:hypothetical protein
MIYRNDDSTKNISFINKDFQSIWAEILEIVPKLTTKWDPRQANESDPLAVLLKLSALFSDKLNYNGDKSALEAFPQTLTQERSAYNVYDILGYKAPWYKAATLNVKLNYSSLVNNTTQSTDAAGREVTIINEQLIDHVLPKFTQVCDNDSTIVFTLLETFQFNNRQLISKEIPAIQGTINDYVINGVNQITADNLDSNNRLYFNEPNVAQNGIFISSDPTFTLQQDWVMVNNIHQALLNDKVYEFGIDPVTGGCYVEFNDNIGNLIGAGLYIKYVLTNGAQGNIKSNTLTKFLTNTEAHYYDSNNEYKSVEINNHITIGNVNGCSNGADPATISEMYDNYKKVQNTFSTLVTLLDYENYLYNYQKGDGTYAVSNIRVSDRTNDLYHSRKVVTLDKSGNHTFITKIDQKGGQDELTAYNIRFYPLRYSNDTATLDGYNNTFKPPVASEHTKVEGGQVVERWFRDSDIDEYISEAKTINHDRLNDGFPIILSTPIDCLVYLTSKVSSTIANQVCDNIRSALYNRFNTRNLTFGKQIRYEELLECIQNADEHIQYVALQKIEDYTLPDDADALLGDDYNLEEEVVRRNILAGVTPWCTFFTTFNIQQNQIAGDIYGLPTLKNGDEGGEIRTKVNQITDTSESKTYVLLDPNGRVLDYDENLVLGSGVDTSRYKIDRPIALLTKPIQVIHPITMVERSQGGESSNYVIKLAPHEQLNLFGPDYISTTTVSNYLYYVYSFTELAKSALVNDGAFVETDGKKFLPKDTPYRLPQGQSIYFFETRDEAYKFYTNGITTGMIYVIKSGEAIKCNFDLYPTYQLAPNQSLDMKSLNNGNAIDKIEKNGGTLVKTKLDNGGVEIPIKVITNARGLIDQLNTTNTSYTLMPNEYFIFQVVGETSLTMLNEGTTISWDVTYNFTKLKEDLTKLLNESINWADVSDGDSTSLPTADNLPQINDGSKFKYGVNQIYSFGEGYCFAYFNQGGLVGYSTSIDSWFNEDGTFKETPFSTTPTLGVQFKLKYCLYNADLALDKQDWVELPTLLQGDDWMGFMRTSLLMGPDNPYLIGEYDLDEGVFKYHKQTLTYTTQLINDGKTQSIKFLQATELTKGQGSDKNIYIVGLKEYNTPSIQPDYTKVITPQVGNELLLQSNIPVQTQGSDINVSTLEDKYGNPFCIYTYTSDPTVQAPDSSTEFIQSNLPFVVPGNPAGYHIITPMYGEDERPWNLYSYKMNSGTITKETSKYVQITSDIGFYSLKCGGSLGGIIDNTQKTQVILNDSTYDGESYLKYNTPSESNFNNINVYTFDGSNIRLQMDAPSLKKYVLSSITATEVDGSTELETVDGVMHTVDNFLFPKDTTLQANVESLDNRSLAAFYPESNPSHVYVRAYKKEAPTSLNIDNTNRIITFRYTDGSSETISMLPGYSYQTVIDPDMTMPVMESYWGVSTRSGITDLQIISVPDSSGVGRFTLDNTTYSVKFEGGVPVSIEPTNNLVTNTPGEWYTFTAPNREIYSIRLKTSIKDYVTNTRLITEYTRRYEVINHLSADFKGGTPIKLWPIYDSIPESLSVSVKYTDVNLLDKVLHIGECVMVADNEVYGIKKYTNPQGGPTFEGVSYKKLTNNDLCGYSEFNPLYLKEGGISEPQLAINFFNEQHALNRYALPKIDFTTKDSQNKYITNIRVSPLSIVD